MLRQSERPVRDLHRLRRYTFWSTVSCGPLALFIAASLLAGSELRGPRLAVAAVAITAATALGTAALVVFMRGDEGRLPRALYWAGMAVMAAGFAAGGINAAWVGAATVLASSPVLWARPGTRARRAVYITAAVIAAAVVLVRLGAAEPLLPVMSLLLLPSLLFGMVCQWWNYEVALELEHSRGLAAELAVAEERLRFAAELHDIQGSHLQAIVLKAQLARRLVTAGPEKAALEMEAVEDLARTALQDTRAVVGGYREVSLADEIASAARILRSAGVRTAVDTDVPKLDTERQRLLGLLVREGTTNLLRHAEATEASLRVATADGSASVMIGNDGAGKDHGDRGNGLAMLDERFTAAGGTVEHLREGGRFILTGSLPLEAKP